MVHGGCSILLFGIPAAVALTWYGPPTRLWFGYADPSSVRISLKTTGHNTLGFQDSGGQPKIPLLLTIGEVFAAPVATMSKARKESDAIWAFILSGHDMDIPKFSVTGHAVDRHALEVAVRVNVTSRVPPFPLTVPPTDEKLTPEGSVPVRVIVSVSADAPVFFMQAYFDCELPTVKFHELIINPVSEYPVVTPQFVPWATSKTAKRLLPTFTRVPVLLMERREAPITITIVETAISSPRMSLMVSLGIRGIEFEPCRFN